MKIAAVALLLAGQVAAEQLPQPLLCENQKVGVTVLLDRATQTVTLNEDAPLAYRNVEAPDPNYLLDAVLLMPPPPGTVGEAARLTLYQFGSNPPQLSTQWIDYDRFAPYPDTKTLRDFLLGLPCRAV